jgi:hypothetical protein
MSDDKDYESDNNRVTTPGSRGRKVEPIVENVSVPSMNQGNQ